jgi:hypothetical protein
MSPLPKFLLDFLELRPYAITPSQFLESGTAGTALRRSILTFVAGNDVNA